jgi:hypothetical protein
MKRTIKKQYCWCGLVIQPGTQCSCLSWKLQTGDFSIQARGEVVIPVPEYIEEPLERLKHLKSHATSLREDLFEIESEIEELEQTIQEYLE